MNIDALLGISGQPLLPDGQGTPLAKKNGESCFNQLLKTFISEETGNPLIVSSGMPDKKNLPVQSSEFRVQSSGLGFNSEPGTKNSELSVEAGLTPDLFEEASTPGSRPRELPVTLTELMTVLQPIVNENSSAELPSLLLTEEETEKTSKEEEIESETNLTVLGLLAGVGPVQTTASFSPIPPLDVAAVEAMTETADTSSTWMTAAAEAANKNSQTTPATLETSSQPVVRPDQPEAVVTPAKATSDVSVAPAPVPFSQVLAHQAAPASTRHGTESLSTAGGESIPRPQAELPVEGLNPILQPDTFQSSEFMVQSSGLGFNSEPGTKNSELYLPALHQIIEKISLMKREESTEVRLHLQPESLGRVLIQLHLADGDVSVRVWAETAQAQSLIQDHLPQLKAALAAQGLQLNGLAVTIGNDASAFDMNGRQPNDWPQGSAPQSNTSGNEANQPVVARPVSQTWDSRHAIDYQV